MCSINSTQLNILPLLFCIFLCLVLRSWDGCYRAKYRLWTPSRLQEAKFLGGLVVKNHLPCTGVCVCVCVWIFTGAALTSWDIEVILLQHVNRSQNELIGKMLTLFILKQLSAVKELPDVSCNVVKHCQWLTAVYVFIILSVHLVVRLQEVDIAWLHVKRYFLYSVDFMRAQSKWENLFYALSVSVLTAVFQVDLG